MSKYVSIGALSGLAALLMVTSAFAQQRVRQAPCPGNEGRTAGPNGQCVNAPLASSMRHRSIHLDQVMINQWMYPNLPSMDRNFPRGFDLNRRETSSEGTGSTSPFPPSR